MFVHPEKLKFIAISLALVRNVCRQGGLLFRASQDKSEEICSYVSDNWAYFNGGMQRSSESERKELGMEG